MAYNNRKWKPNKAQVEAWLANKESVENDFKNEISKIEKEFNIVATINKTCNSIYFIKNEEKFRISTHAQIDKGNFNFDKNHIIENSIITNSRENIIKKFREIAEKK